MVSTLESLESLVEQGNRLSSVLLESMVKYQLLNRWSVSEWMLEYSIGIGDREMSLWSEINGCSECHNRWSSV